MEVAQICEHAPSMWSADMDHTMCQNAAELIKLAANKEEQLIASSMDTLQELV